MNRNFPNILQNTLGKIQTTDDVEELEKMMLFFLSGIVRDPNLEKDFTILYKESRLKMMFLTQDWEEPPVYCQISFENAVEQTRKVYKEIQNTIVPIQYCHPYEFCLN